MRPKVFCVGLCSLVFVAAISTVASATDPPTFVRRWGEFGHANGQFSDPSGICVDNAGNLYVADRGNNRVQKFSNTDVFLGAFGTSGSDPGQFTNPHDVEVDAAGNIYVSDDGRIQVFDASFAFLRQWSTRLVVMEHLDLDPTQQFLYAGAGTEIFQFDPLGNLILQWSYTGLLPSSGPGIGVGPSGSVYVTDQALEKVRKYTGDGLFITEWGDGGRSPGHFLSPKALAVDQNETIYVGDGEARLQQFTGSGDFLALWGSVGTGDGQFLNVVDFAIDANLTIYVLDQRANQVQVFSDPATSTQRSSWGEVKRRYR